MQGIVIKTTNYMSGAINPGQQESGSMAAADWATAKQLYENGEYEACFFALPGGFRKDVDFRPLYPLAAAAAAQLDAPHAQELFTQAAENPEDAAAFDELGNLYLGGDDFETALAFLGKAVMLDPANTGALYDLAICHTRLNQLDQAADVLQNASSHDFWTMYLLHKLKLFKQDTRGVQEFIDKLLHSLSNEPGEEDIEKMKTGELQEMLQRFNSAGTIRQHIRDWHFIQYGGAVLDCYESEGGRYSSVSCSTESIKTLAENRKLFVDTLSVPVKTVAALPDRDSEIIGRLLAKTLNTGFEIYDYDHPPADALITAADTRLFDEYYELGTITNGQVLFSACHNWRKESYVCPDIIGFMAQSCLFPWQGGGVKITDREKHLFEPLERDDRDTAAIAEEIFTSPAAEQDKGSIAEFYSGKKNYLKAIGSLAGGNRYNFMIESPVADACFL